MFSEELCEHHSCKNSPDSFPGRISYMATKPGINVLMFVWCYNQLTGARPLLWCLLQFLQYYAKRLYHCAQLSYTTQHNSSDYFLS